MTSSEIKHYIDIRAGELSSDEIINMLDVSRHPQIDHFEYKNGKYHMWDKEGNYFLFVLREWN